MDAATRAHRTQTLALRAQTIRDLQRIWPTLDFDRLDATFPTWLAAALAIVQRDRTRAAGLGSLYVRASRDAAEVPGPATVQLAQRADPGLVSTSLYVTSVIAVKRAMTAGRLPREAMASAFTLSSGAASRHVLDAARETVRASVEADPRGRGWTRVASGRACDFCTGLADGSVLPGSVPLARHDSCACSAQPVYA